MWLDAGDKIKEATGSPRPSHRYGLPAEKFKPNRLNKTKRMELVAHARDPLIHEHAPGTPDRDFTASALTYIVASTLLKNIGRSDLSSACIHRFISNRQILLPAGRISASGELNVMMQHLRHSAERYSVIALPVYLNRECA